MNNLLSSIMTKTTGSALSTDVNGRVFLDRAPEETEFPYVSFFIVSGVPDDVFNKKGKDIILQFDLFSNSEGAAEITDMYNDLHSLFDDCSLAITSNNLVWMKETNVTTMTEDITTASGTQKVKHWAVDYQIQTQSS